MADLGHEGLIPTLVREILPLANKVCMQIMSLKVGDKIYLDAEQWVERRKDGLYTVDRLFDEVHRWDPAELVYALLMFAVDINVDHMIERGLLPKPKGDQDG